jgi:polyferredoxin
VADEKTKKVPKERIICMATKKKFKKVIGGDIEKYFDMSNSTKNFFDVILLPLKLLFWAFLTTILMPYLILQYFARRKVWWEEIK